MQCRFEGHQNKHIEGFCVDAECDHYPFFCRKCFRELHNKHLKQCIMFDESPELLENLLQNQESLKNGLTGLLTTISAKSGVLIQNLERNIKIIKNLNDILREQRLDDIKKNVPLIKHYYGFQEQAQSGYGTKIENVIHEFQKIQEELEGQIKLLSNPASLYITKGFELLNDKQYEKAILQLDKAINLDSLSVDALILKAKALRNIKIYDQAQELIDQALKINKNNPKIYLEQGNLLKNQNIFQEALPLYEECLRLDPNNLEAILGKGDCLFQLKEYQDAIKYYEEVIKQDNQHYDGLIGIGLTLQETRSYDQAQIYFQKATLIDPLKAQGFYYRGLSLKSLILQRIQQNNLQHPKYSFTNLTNDSFGCFDKAFELDSNNIQAKIECADLRIRIHEFAQNKALINDAIKELEQVLIKQPSNQQVYYLMGRALEGNGQTDEAIKNYNQGLQIDPSNEKINDAKVKAETKLKEKQIEGLIKQNKCQEATQLLTNSNVSELQKLNIYGQLGQQLITQREFLKALDILAQQFSIINDFGKQHPQYLKWVNYIRFQYGQISFELMKTRQFEKAIECFDIIVELPNTSFLAYQHVKGDCLFQMAKFSEAIVAYEELLKGNKITKIQYYQRIGLCLLKQEKFQQAIENFDKYIEESLELIKNNNGNIKRGVKYNPEPNKITGDYDVYKPADLERFLQLYVTYENKSRALFFLNKDREALEMINEALSLNTELPQYYYLQSQILAKLGYSDQSERSLELAKKKGIPIEHLIFRFEFEELKIQGLMLIQQQKYEEALKYYEKLVILKPYDTQTYVELCQILLLCKKPKKCLKLIDQAIQLSPKSQLIYEFQIIQLHSLVYDLISAQKYAQALIPLIKSFKLDSRLLEKYAKEQGYFYKIGIGLFNNSIYSKAIESFEYQILLYEKEKDKNYKNAIYYKCLSLYRLQQYDQVMSNLEYLITQSDCQSQVFCLLGDTLFMKQKYDEAITGYQEASQKELNYHYFINIGDCLVQKQQYKEAIDQYDLLLQTELELNLNLQNIALIHKAKVLLIQEQNEQAIIILRQILERDPNHFLAYYHLQQSLQKLGQINEAMNQTSFNGLLINDQTESLLMDISELLSDKTVPIDPFK